MSDISFHSIVVLEFTLICANVFNDLTARSFFFQRINLNRSSNFATLDSRSFNTNSALPLKKQRRKIRFVIVARIKLLYLRNLFFLYSDGPLTGVPFIDDYISTTEQVSVFGGLVEVVKAKQPLLDEVFHKPR